LILDPYVIFEKNLQEKIHIFDQILEYCTYRIFFDQKVRWKVSSPLERTSLQQRIFFFFCNFFPSESVTPDPSESVFNLDSQHRLKSVSLQVVLGTSSPQLLQLIVGAREPNIWNFINGAQNSIIENSLNSL
jgi:hypothetical protein